MDAEGETARSPETVRTSNPPSTANSPATPSESRARFTAPSRDSVLKEICDLKEALRSEPQIALPHPTDVNKDKRKAVAKWVEGKPSTLECLTRTIDAVLWGSEEGAQSSSTRNLILDVATRKYYGHKEGKPVNIDAFDDETLAPFWFWEVRVVSDIPEEVRPPAVLARKKRKKIQDRLNVLHEVLKVTVESPGKRKISEARVKKAFDKYSKTDGLAAILAEHQHREEEEARKGLARDRSVKVKASEQKERIAQKVEEKETKVAEALGFGTKKSLTKAQNLLMSFATRKKEQREGASPGGKAKSQDLDPFHERFTPCPPNKRLCLSPCSEEASQALDKGIAVGMKEQDLRLNFSNSVEKWSKNARFRVRIKGRPPSWARKPDCPSTFHEFAADGYREDFSEVEVKTWRRKYIWFPSDSDCPPYYGSWTASAFRVNPRKPLVKLAAVDYEEMFDEGWEEEPDGESLSGEEDNEEDAEDNDSQDGFVVEDGYLSPDEGIREIEMENLTELQATTSSCPTSDQSKKHREVLQQILNRATKSGKPVVFSRLGGSREGDDRGPLNYTLASSEFLQGLRLSCFGSERITMPCVASLSRPSPTQERKPSTRGRPKQVMTPEQTANLIEFLKTPNSKEKVVEAFFAQYPASNVSKSSVREKIVELAHYSSLHRGWVLKSEKTVDNPVQFREQCPQPHIAAPQPQYLPQIQQGQVSGSIPASFQVSSIPVIPLDYRNPGVLAHFPVMVYQTGEAAMVESRKRSFAATVTEGSNDGMGGEPERKKAAVIDLSDPEKEK
ncbi:hypothetical protein BSKO_00749 [Bryopsis sp. KO-2023]|nr:hypothetical protein BSKO_00749 [Bryopsis sp. KO-2023]